MYSETKLTVRYAETDQMGIAHHSNYAVWYELARTDFVRKNGMSYSEMESSGLALPLIGLTCKFILPAHYEDELIVKTKMGKLTPVRMVFEYEVYKDGKLINTGSTEHVVTNSNLKPINLKKENPKIYEFLVGVAEGNTNEKEDI